MGILNRLVGTESTAKAAERADEDAVKHWKHYLTTVERKHDIIRALPGADLKELRKLLRTELSDVEHEDRDESEIIKDLESLEHDKRIKRVHRLEDCLAYGETKYEYVYHLMRKLHGVLTSQIHIVEKLISGPKDAARLIDHLKKQAEIENEILGKIRKIETFHDLFSALVKGEHVVERMNSREKRLMRTMQRIMDEIFFGELDEGITFEWVSCVANKIEDEVHEGLAAQYGYHPNIDFEYVNRPEFVKMVRWVIDDLKHPRTVSDKMIKVFVRVFREWYNHARD